jgi:hypothetical protein
MSDGEYLHDRPAEGTLGRSAEQALADAGAYILASFSHAASQLPDERQRTRMLDLHASFALIWAEALAMRETHRRSPAKRTPLGTGHMLDPALPQHSVLPDGTWRP